MYPADLSRYPQRNACAAAVALALASGTYSLPVAAQSYAPWLNQIGLTNTIASAAKWGNGQLIGVVDTGINATHPQFAAGQVSQLSSGCAAVSFRCSNGFADDNGHGTSVASIAAGNRVSQFATVSGGGYTTTRGSFISVAPSANIAAQKVLNAAGSGYSTDVANGVRKAADAGAGVINVSITYSNDANTVAAINYAAAKGAFIVWAGGNSAQNLLNNLNTSGLTQAAIQRLVFAGSVNSANVASGFTNKPGTGALVSTAGARTAYSARWVMAPGEAILAPYTTYGNNAYYLWSGTSMAAPIVSGSLILLQNAWPILKTKGTTANLLLATASDLGAKGLDSTYGNGLVNLQAAFNPYGTLMVTRANGQSVAVSSLTGSLISSGALGSLTAIQSKLANYTAFDSYGRNFSVNLAGLIKSPSNKATRNPLPTNTYTAPRVMKYADGELAFSLQATGGQEQHIGEFGYNPDAEQQMVRGYTLFTNKAESVLGFGYGSATSYPFAKALYNDDLLAQQVGDFDTGSLTNLAQGGYQFAYGMKLSPTLRVASYYSSTPSPTVFSANVSQNAQYKVGISYQFDNEITAGVTYGNISEQSSLLGAAYTSGSILALGSNSTEVLGLSAAYRLSRDSSLMFNADIGFTKAGAGDSGSLFSATSAIQTRAFGMTYLQQNLWKVNDQFIASIKQPLRIHSGQAALITAGVDEEGYAVYEKSWSSLVPDGREVDFTLAYRMPTSSLATLTLQAAYQKDAMNVSGNNAALLGLLWNSRF